MIHHGWEGKAWLMVGWDMIHHGWEGVVVGNSMVLKAWTWGSSCHTSEQQGMRIWLSLLALVSSLGPQLVE